MILKNKKSGPLPDHSYLLYTILGLRPILLNQTGLGSLPCPQALTKSFTNFLMNQHIHTLLAIARSSEFEPNIKSARVPTPFNSPGNDYDLQNSIGFETDFHVGCQED
jgi:hypothetical protein